MSPKVTAEGVGQQPKSAKLEVWIFLSTCLLAWVWMWLHLNHGFLLEDDPVFAHQAERVLHGEIPHVDYHEVYTGGLSYLGALSMRIFGVHLMAPRYALFGFFCAWVSAFWYVARRFSGPRTASLLTVLAVSWSTPLYPSPVPSWYNLFFATFGAAALMGFLDVRRKRWLAVAGICGGLSFLAKISGLYFIAAAGLFLLFDEQEESAGIMPSSRDPAFSTGVTMALLAFIVLLFEMVRKLPFLVEYFNFVLPSAALCFLLGYREWTIPKVTARTRIYRLASRFGPFLTGVLLPVCVFIVPYLYTGTMHQFLIGVFVLPQARLTTYVRMPAPVTYALYYIPLMAVLILDRILKKVSTRRYCAMVITAAMAILLLICFQNPAVAGRIFVSASSSIPLIIVASTMFLLFRPNASGRWTSQFFLLLATTALCSLNQFPYSGPFYFCYVAPLLVLVMGAFAHLDDAQALPLALPIAIFFLLFGLLLVGPAQAYVTQFLHPSYPQKRFSFDRAGGLYGGSSTVAVIERVTSEVTPRCAGAPIYAGPNAAGLYFLTGCRNATPNIYEFVSGKDGEADSILNRIDAAGARVIVLNHENGMSGAPPIALVEGLIERFPEYEMIGHFEIRWKP